MHAAQSRRHAVEVGARQQVSGVRDLPLGPGKRSWARLLVRQVGAVRPGAGADVRFAAVLDACGALARSVGMERVLAGINLAREEAYQLMLARGFRSQRNLVTMHRTNEPGYSRRGVYVIDDWR